MSLPGDMATSHSLMSGHARDVDHGRASFIASSLGEMVTLVIKPVLDNSYGPELKPDQVIEAGRFIPSLAYRMMQRGKSLRVVVEDCRETQKLLRFYVCRSGRQK